MIVTDAKKLAHASTDVKASEIERVLGALCKEMKLQDKNACGLAAPQIGIRKRAFIFKNARDEWIEVVNPIITNMYEDIVFPNEACLSFPGKSVTTKRFRNVHASFENVLGERKKYILCDMEAVIFQHEFDHLEGKTMFDRQTKVNSTFAPQNKVGRNSPCPCGSGKKYKKCCLKKDENEAYNV